MRRAEKGAGANAAAPAAEKNAATHDENLLLVANPHICRGLNQCKNQGKTKMNACAGQGACATAESHSCDGLNSCKGQGGCDGYPGQNQCKAQGACAVPLKDDTWTESPRQIRANHDQESQAVWFGPRKKLDATMNTTRDLAQIQRWMQSVIMNPAGVIDGIASADAQAEIDVSLAEVEMVIQRSAQQTSVERLQIYAGAYYARLLECLRAEFPVMVKAMGEELFDEFAVEYLRQYPSRSYTLDDLGTNFAKFLAVTRPTSATEDNSWLDFLADLAKLEWNFAEVFDGGGAEHCDLLAPSNCSRFPPSVGRRRV